MLKTTFKVIMLFVLLVLVAVSTGLATYNITKNMIEEQVDIARQTSAIQPIIETVDREEDYMSTRDGRQQGDEYYLVRLEGDTLEVYVARSGKEEFLYNYKVYKNSLSEGDIRILYDGVRLESFSELTAFIENFTS